MNTNKYVYIELTEPQMRLILDNDAAYIQAQAEALKKVVHKDNFLSEFKVSTEIIEACKELRHTVDVIIDHLEHYNDFRRPLTPVDPREKEIRK